jgi:hypothetical protein
LPSFFYASKRCSSIRSHWSFTPVLKPCLSLLEYSSSSLLRLGSLSLKPPSLSLLSGSLLCDARAWECVALTCLGLVCVASLWLRPASTVVDIAVSLDERRDGVCRLKLVTRNEFYSRLDSEVVNLRYMADAYNKLNNLAERDSSLNTIVADHYYKEIVV